MKKIVIVMLIAVFFTIGFLFGYIYVIENAKINSESGYDYYYYLDIDGKRYEYHTEENL